MQRKHQLLAGIAAAVVLQIAPAQVAPGVSMTVTTGQATFGRICEPFQCAPHVVPVTPSEAFLVEVYGAASQPYLLFAGPPAAGCASLPWVLGELAMDLPILLLDVGVVPDAGWPVKCGVERVGMKLEIPIGAPPGAELVLQGAAFPAAIDMPAFTRGARLTVV